MQSKPGLGRADRGGRRGNVGLGLLDGRGPRAEHEHFQFAFGGAQLQASLGDGRFGLEHLLLGNLAAGPQRAEILHHRFGLRQRYLGGVDRQLVALLFLSPRQRLEQPQRGPPKPRGW